MRSLLPVNLLTKPSKQMLPHKNKFSHKEEFEFITDNILCALLTLIENLKWDSHETYLCFDKCFPYILNWKTLLYFTVSLTREARFNSQKPQVVFNSTAKKCPMSLMYTFFCCMRCFVLGMSKSMSTSQCATLLTDIHANARA